MKKHLIVVAFRGKHRASEVLGQLERLAYDWNLDLKDAVAAYRTDDGKLRVDQSMEPTAKEGGGYGALLGGLLGAVIAAPLTGGLSVAAAATAVGLGAAALGSIGGTVGAQDAGSWKRAYGVSDEFVREVGGMIQPRDSALFAVIRGADPQAIADQFRGYGGTVLHTTLPPKVAERVQNTLRGDA